MTFVTVPSTVLLVRAAIQAVASYWNSYQSMGAFPTGIWTNIDFTATNFNTGGAATPAGSLGEAWQDGLYKISGSVWVHGTRKELRVLVNGSEYERYRNESSGGDWDTFDFTTTAQLSVDDEIKFQVLVSGGNPSLPGEPLFVHGEIIAFNAIPEPSTLTLAALGLLGLLGFRRRRRR